MGLPLGIALTLLIGCAGQEKPATSASANSLQAKSSQAKSATTPNPIAGADDAISTTDRLLETLESYRAGVELIAAHDDEGGRQRLQQARDALTDAANRCSQGGDCAPEALATTTELLLGESQQALLAQAVRIRQLEAQQEAEIVEGEGEPLEAIDPVHGPSVGSLTPAFEAAPKDLGNWLTLNAKVEAELDDWLTWRRPMLIESWINYQYLRSIMAPIYADADLPESLLFAMLATESNGKVHASSKAGALGPLQFMSYTGNRYGLTTVNGFDLRLDPTAATQANVAYLKEQLDALGGDLELTLAAYNGGENRMRGLHRRYPNASFWDHSIYYALPRETRQYVPRILAAARLFVDPGAYNLVFPEVSTKTAQVVLVEDASVGELSICLGSTPANPVGWFRTVRNLNPRLEARDRVQAGTEVILPIELVETYRTQCQRDDLLATAHALYQANYPPQPELIHYRVARGDTLSRIASRHRCASLAEISALNSIRGPQYTIRVGQTLKIPSCQ
ncbi:MAG: transglycosylase SLT domain-containing protein [Thermoanaerobaculia bacterium]|nr:transglycosylase SLT domain-containing protein [Thermoanaerobaculia bacterium]